MPGIVYDTGCTACPLHETAKYVCVPSSGGGQYRCMVIGEAPGRQEDAVGRPFVGRAGKILDHALVLAFVTPFARRETFVTNVVKCRPPGNRTPTQFEMDTCMDLYLAREIEVVDPIAILALGNAAISALLGFTGISSVRGTWHELNRDKPTLVMPTWHPAYVGYNGDVGSPTWHEFLSDIESFANKVIASSEVPL